jgi:hypothetical protein
MPVDANLRSFFKLFGFEVQLKDDLEYQIYIPYYEVSLGASVLENKAQTPTVIATS